MTKIIQGDYVSLLGCTQRIDKNKKRREKPKCLLSGNETNGQSEIQYEACQKCAFLCHFFFFFLYSFCLPIDQRVNCWVSSGNHLKRARNNNVKRVEEICSQQKQKKKDNELTHDVMINYNEIRNICKLETGTEDSI